MLQGISQGEAVADSALPPPIPSIQHGAAKAVPRFGTSDQRNRHRGPPRSPAMPSRSAPAGRAKGSPARCQDVWMSP